jgi:hypothetical protein
MACGKKIISVGKNPNIVAIRGRPLPLNPAFTRVHKNFALGVIGADEAMARPHRADSDAVWFLSLGSANGEA